METRVVIFALLLITYVQAAPAPKKFSLVKDSTFGFGASAVDSKTVGVLQDTNAPKQEKREGDVALIEDENHGASFAFAGSLAFGVIKGNTIAGDNLFSKL
ncbi:unnamed protein product [Chrysodeixis includens]|uniref:Uncharacterized protein n=1 Tax=Chrysodeixis includens TaxID=689277 RepID=A0A9P0FUF6_CHRIL|nr:unnamed protein product [Chrysodeixis includens]